MKIVFSLGWLQRANSSRKSFKSNPAELLFKDYIARVAKFTPCEISGSFDHLFSRNSHVKLWLCERSQAKMLSSQEIATNLEKILQSGCKELWIGIGGADGFKEAEISKLKPDLKWSFGPLTLPHELAAVLASEQIYRAWTILRHTPYHSEH